MKMYWNFNFCRFLLNCKAVYFKEQYTIFAMRDCPIQMNCPVLKLVEARLSICQTLPLHFYLQVTVKTISTLLQKHQSVERNEKMDNGKFYCIFISCLFLGSVVASSSGTHSIKISNNVLFIVH